MNIALIIPKSPVVVYPPLKEFAESGSTGFLISRRQGAALSLLVIDALTPKDNNVEFIDERYENINYDKQYDIVGITIHTANQARRAYEIGDKFIEKGVTVVMGGIHATVRPEEAKKHANTVVVGEAENTWPELLEDYKNNRLKSFYKQIKPIDLTKSPIPSYNLFEKYKEHYNVIYVQTTRGCPHDCNFCAATKIYGPKYRHKTIEQVVEEIELIKKVFDKVFINFADDNMFVNRRYAKELLKALIPLRVRFMSQTDVSIAYDDELLDLLPEAGCASVLIGFESVYKDAFKHIEGSRTWKEKYLDKYPEIISKIQKKGIGVLGAFMVGLDSDDLSIFQKLGDFIIKNHLMAVHITVLTPVPGTELRKKLEKENRILDTPWDNYTYLDVNFTPKNMTPEQLQEEVYKLWKRVYSKEVIVENNRYMKSIYKDIVSKEYEKEK
ncbi:MAG: B12-binding domain-containing radical SAM protein [PVC group bacterium]|nr:B12-binding domain-containing radical SAM protein [PVC group bacterium]